jgi:hypothetical protein
MENKVPLIAVQSIHAPSSINSEPSNAPLYTPVNESRPVPRSRGFGDFVNKWWITEIASAGAAILTLAAMLGFLYYLDGKTIWTGKPNVNSILSFITTITKATLLMPVASAMAQLKWKWFHQERTLSDIEVFDEGGRGVLGSVKLILKLRFW